MNRIVLFLGALLLAVTLGGTGASARGHHHHHHGLMGHHHQHGLMGHGWYHGGWHHGFRQHSAGGPTRLGPHCWVATDDARGYGYFKWCGDERPAHHGKHHHRHHHHHH